MTRMTRECCRTYTQQTCMPIRSTSCEGNPHPLKLAHVAERHRRMGALARQQIRSTHRTPSTAQNLLAVREAYSTDLPLLERPHNLTRRRRSPILQDRAPTDRRLWPETARTKPEGTSPARGLLRPELGFARKDQ